MTTRPVSARAGSRDPRSAALARRIFCVLLCFGTASAQTVPYTSTTRLRVGSGLGQTPLPRGLYLEPRIETAVQYVDNINLAQKGEDRVSTLGIEVAPGAYASYSSDAITAAIDYSLIGRLWDDSAYNDVSQRLAANGRWYALPDLFYLDGQASWRDAIIDPSRGLNYGGFGIFGPTNIVQQATAGVSPTIDKRFHDDYEFIWRYSYGRVWYLDKGNNGPTIGFVSGGDSKDQTVHTSFGTIGSDRKFSAKLFYDWQKSEYQTSLPYQFERAGVDLGWAFTRTVSLVGDAGRESDLNNSTTAGGLDSEFWSAGFRWAPDHRNSIEARYGQRFFGDSYSVELHRSARHLELDASYAESPAVETRRLSIGDFNPANLPPDSPSVDFGLFTSSPYVGRNAHAGITAIGARTNVRLSWFLADRDYLLAGRPDETANGVNLDVTRRLASNLSAEVITSYSDYNRAPITLQPPFAVVSHDYDTQFLFRLTREVGLKLRTSAETGWLSRSGTRNYDGWWIGLRATWFP